MINFLKPFGGKYTLVEVFESDVVRFKMSYLSDKSESPSNITYTIRGIFYTNEFGIPSFRVTENEDYEFAQRPEDRLKEIDELEPESRKDTIYGDSKLLVKGFARDISHYTGFTLLLLEEKLRSFVVSGEFVNNSNRRLIQTYFVKKRNHGGMSQLYFARADQRTTFVKYETELTRVFKIKIAFLTILIFICIILVTVFDKIKF